MTIVDLPSFVDALDEAGQLVRIDQAVSLEYELADVAGSEFTMRRIDAGDAGLDHAPIEAIRGGDAVHNAKALEALLGGTPGPYRDAVLLNAAATLIVAGRIGDWREGAAMAAEALDSGKARDLLARWIDMAK